MDMFLFAQIKKVARQLADVVLGQIPDGTITDTSLSNDAGQLKDKVTGLDATLADITQYLNTPIATYTHSTNKEVVVSAVDTTADIFTSVAHGLNNGDKIYPISNYNAGAIYPIDKYPGGIGYITGGYFVVNKTNDTFQLSLTSGGAAIDLTTNANLDLTKWHFETVISDLTISGLPNLVNCKVLIKGKCLKNGCGVFILPNNIAAVQDWVSTIIGTYTYSSFTCGGDLATDIEAIISYKRWLTVKVKGMKSTSATSSSNSNSLIDKIIKNPNYRDSTITSILFVDSTFANGTVVEVYKA